MGQLFQYEQELLKDTELICTPLSELKLEGLKTPADSCSDAFTFTDNANFNAACSVFPSPDSDVITPSSSNSDAIPSPASDDVPSPSRSNFNNEFSNMKPFTLDIDFTKKNTQSRTFALKLDVEKR